MAKSKTSWESKVIGRSGGKDVTQKDLDRIVREAEDGYDVDKILRRR